MKNSRHSIWLACVAALWFCIPAVADTANSDVGDLDQARAEQALSGRHPWIDAQSSFGVVVTIAHDCTDSPVALSFHRSHNPAKPNMPRSFITIAYGCLVFGSSFFYL